MAILETPIKAYRVGKRKYHFEHRGGYSGDTFYYTCCRLLLHKDCPSEPVQMSFVSEIEPKDICKKCLGPMLALPGPYLPTNEE